jgi:hypothetical protein
MARKMNPPKPAQEIRVQAAATGLAAFYLTHMRPPGLKIPATRRRLPVAVDAETRAQIEHPVKIIHAG